MLLKMLHVRPVLLNGIQEIPNQNINKQPSRSNAANVNVTMLPRTIFIQVLMASVMILLQQQMTTQANEEEKREERADAAPLKSTLGPLLGALEPPRQRRQMATDPDGDSFLDYFEGKYNDNASNEDVSFQEFEVFKNQVNSKVEKENRTQLEFEKLLSRLPHVLRMQLKNLIADGGVIGTQGSSAASVESAAADLPAPIQFIKATMNSGLRR